MLFVNTYARKQQPHISYHGTHHQIKNQIAHRTVRHSTVVEVLVLTVPCTCSEIMLPEISNNRRIHNERQKSLHGNKQTLKGTSMHLCVTI